MCLRSWSTRNQARPSRCTPFTSAEVSTSSGPVRSAFFIIAKYFGRLDTSERYSSSTCSPTLTCVELSKSPMTGLCPALGKRRVGDVRRRDGSGRRGPVEPEPVPQCREGFAEQVGQGGEAVAGTPARDGGPQRGHGRATHENGVDVGRRVGARPTDHVVDEEALHGVVGGQVPRGQGRDLPDQAQPKQPLLTSIGQVVQAREQHALDDLERLLVGGRVRGEQCAQTL